MLSPQSDHLPKSFLLYSFFEQWPEEIKQFYRFDPEGAEKLLDEAAYPRGSDGIRFSITLEPISVLDLNYFELAIEYFGRIGVEVKMDIPELADFGNRAREHKYDGMISHISGVEDKPALLLQFVSTSEWNPSGAQDPEMDR